MPPLPSSFATSRNQLLGTNPDTAGLLVGLWRSLEGHRAAVGDLLAVQATSRKVRACCVDQQRGDVVSEVGLALRRAQA